jgi:hypothetical protein
LEKMTENERQQHEQMANLGLGDFETWQQCSDRQDLMLRRFKAADERRPPATRIPAIAPGVGTAVGSPAAATGTTRSWRLTGC